MSVEISVYNNVNTGVGIMVPFAYRNNTEVVGGLVIPNVGQ
jgi:hypothetical protein